MDFIRDTIKTYKAMLQADNAFVQDGGVLAQIKRAPIGAPSRPRALSLARAPLTCPPPAPRRRQA